MSELSCLSGAIISPVEKVGLLSLQVLFDSGWHRQSLCGNVFIAVVVITSSKLPICHKCGNSFPNKIITEKKILKAYDRKYCLVCSPFGSHNTTSLEDPNKARFVGNLTCKNCGIVYYYIRRNRRGATRQYCSSCYGKGIRTNSNGVGKKVVSFRQRIKDKAIMYKGGRCIFCGYYKCKRALEFHHLNPAKKNFAISDVIRSWDKVKAEIDKCVLVCANCHRELESGLRTLKETSVKNSYIHQTNGII